MRILFAIGIAVSALLLTSCTNPDTSGGVTMQKEVGDGHPSNWPFPHGSCSGAHAYAASNTGCGWVTAGEKTYYIMPNADLSSANLEEADLSSANLTGADLTDADLGRANLSNANLTGADLGWSRMVAE